MIAFAVVVTVGFGHLALWLLLVAASAVWAVVGVGTYFLVRRLLTRRE